MRYLLAAGVLVLALAGCGSSAAPAAPTPTAVATATGVPATVPGARSNATPRPAAVAVDGGFASIVRVICGALARRDAGTVTAALPYYQYNSGLRYGMLGDGEGQTGDPSLMTTWLAHSHVQCKLQSSGSHEHGTVLATGWPQPGGTALIEFDTYSGRWKINDFTFGVYGPLARAIQTAGPIVPYTG